MECHVMALICSILLTEVLCPAVMSATICYFGLTEQTLGKQCKVYKLGEGQIPGGGGASALGLGVCHVCLSKSGCTAL